MLRRFLLVSLVSTFAACNAISGVGDLAFTGVDDDPETTCPSGFGCGEPSAGGTLVISLEQQCPPGWDETDVVYDATDPGCSECSCTASGGTCEPVVLDKWTVNTCAMSLGTEQLGTCVDVISAGSGYSAEPPQQSQNATCTARGGAPLPLTGWRLCSTSSDEPTPCGDGQICVPDDPQGPCLVMQGSCPPEAPVSVSGYRTVDDGRSCECTCTPNTCAGADVELYEQPACGGSPVATFAADGMCVSTAGLPIVASVRGVVASATATCDPTVAQTGAPQFSDATQLCCATTP